MTTKQALIEAFIAAYLILAPLIMFVQIYELEKSSSLGWWLLCLNAGIYFIGGGAYLWKRRGHE